MRVEIFLFLTLVGVAFSASTYIAVHNTETIPPLPDQNYEDWRDYIWGQTSPSGYCYHIATYETQEELDAMIEAVQDNAFFIANPASPISLYLGAQKKPNSNTFVWAVGSRRGQPFFSANLVVDNSDRYIDINYESGFICHQEYCFDREDFMGYDLIYDADTEAVLVRVTSSGYQVIADDAAPATYGILEVEDGKIANANGGSKFILSGSPLNWVEASNQVNIAGAYLARIESSEQEQWILDELQCIAFEDIWIGVQDDIFGNLVKGPGPAQRQVLWEADTEKCVPDVYCNYDINGHAKRALDDFPGLFPYNAVYLESTTGYWELDDPLSQKRYLYQAEYCSLNANEFFRFSFAENEKVDSRVCKPNPTSDWKSNDNIFDANHFYFTEKSFFAGAGVIFSNPDTDQQKLLYFDCNCQSDPIIDLACLGGDAFPGCQLYTNNFDYYYLGIYYNRMIQGLAYAYENLIDYQYWKIIYSYIDY